jgi:hypothetical protein
MSDPVAALFEQELGRRGVPFRVDSASARYVVPHEGVEKFVSLGNLAREYARDRDPSRVSRFIDTVLTARQDHVSWNDARPSILLCLEPSDHVEPPAFRTPVSDRVDQVPVHFNAATGAISWITPRMLDDWRVTLEDIKPVALTNLSGALTTAKIEHRDIDGVRLGYVGTALPFKSALILAPNLKEVVSPVCGWPLHAVVPDRDFLYVWAAQHTDFIARVGRVVVDEFTAAPYPLTTEVFEIGDAGISAIGAFPVDP